MKNSVVCLALALAIILFWASDRAFAKSPLDASQTCNEFLKKGSAEGQYLLGRQYEMGQGGNVDFQKAATLYKIAAELYKKAALTGLSHVQYDIWRCSEPGIGVAKDMESAVKYYTVDAEQNLSHAQLRLGHYYELGTDVEQSVAQVSTFYGKAAAQGGDAAKVTQHLLVFSAS